MQSDTQASDLSSDRQTGKLKPSHAFMCSLDASSRKLAERIVKEVEVNFFFRLGNFPDILDSGSNIPWTTSRTHVWKILLIMLVRTSLSFFFLKKSVVFEKMDRFLCMCGFR